MHHHNVSFASQWTDGPVALERPSTHAIQMMCPACCMVLFSLTLVTTAARCC
jgi:hypothetical protein